MKKFLSLVLVLAMTFSLVAVSASAKEYTDDSKITYGEAVDVVSSLGIVGGYGDGSFGPDALLTRGAAAKIICNMILGPTTASALGATTAPFTDVPANHTFAGYIAYCSEHGIISGYGDGTFRPSGSLTGYAFMKMLLGALGYDSKVEGFTGSNWTVNVAKLAVGIGLNKGNSSFVGSKAVTRQEACLYAFNTLKANMIEYDSSLVAEDGELNTISKAKDMTTTKDDYRDSKANANNDRIMQFCEMYFTDLKLDDVGETDSYARPAHKWYNGTKISKNLIGTYVDDAILTYTTGVKGTELAKDVEDAGYEFKDNTPITVVRNNGTANTVAYATIDAALKSSNKIGGNGVVLELYADKDGYVNKVVVICTYLAKVESVITDKASTATIDERALSISFASGEFISLNRITAEQDVPGFDDVYSNVKKGDYILVVPKADNSSSSEALAVSLPQTATGALTYFKTGETVKVGDTTYSVADTYAEGAANGAFALTSKNVTLYLDAYGYVIGYTGPSTSGDKAVVALKEYKSLNSDGEIVNMFKGVTSNGETVDWEYETENGGATPVKDTMYTYKDVDDDNKYELTPVATSSQVNSAVVDSATVCVGDKTINASDKSLLAGNSPFTRVYFADDVKFIFFNDGKAVVKDGVQKVAADATNVWVTVKMDGGVAYATAVYVAGTTSASSTTSDDLVFVKAGSQGNVQVTVDGKDKTYTVYNAYVNGEKLDLFYTDDAVTTGFYSIEKEDASGAYVLSGNSYSATTGALAVSGQLDVLRFAGNIMTATAANTEFDVSEAVVVDTTSNGLEISSIGELKNEVADHTSIDVYVVYDADTHVASYVYLTAYTPAP